jgi:hypothetical protein
MDTFVFVWLQDTYKQYSLAFVSEESFPRP